MGRILKFEYYYRDKLCSSVTVDYPNRKVYVTNHTDDIISQAFGKQKVTIDSIDEFFRERVFPESRVNCQQLLDRLGMKIFDAEAICRLTHGSMVDDEYWVKFEGDSDEVNWNLIQEMRKESL